MHRLKVLVDQPWPRQGLTSLLWSPPTSRNGSNGYKKATYQVLQQNQLRDCCSGAVGSLHLSWMGMINVFLYDSTLPQKLLIPDPPTAEHFSLFRIKDSHSSGCGKKGFVSGIGKATRAFKLTGYPIIFHRRTQTCSQGLPGGFPCYLPLKILKGEFPANSSGCPCCPVSPSLLRQREDFLKGCASVSAN